ncbi:hypothetical protein AMQ68_20670 [Chryseobacterium sp. ERMR1:04]|nr:hypothetical protein AMQ68_20670 [Chryseobacterium sp. ERMR1:04]
MGILISVVIILSLLALPIIVKGEISSKIISSFLLGLFIIPLLINVERWSSKSSQGDILLCMLNFIGYIVFNIISLIILLIKPQNRREYFFFFPIISAMLVFIFTSMDGVKYAFLIVGNILIAFLPLYVYIYYLLYKKRV